MRTSGIIISTLLILGLTWTTALAQTTTDPNSTGGTGNIPELGDFQKWPQAMVKAAAQQVRAPGNWVLQSQQTPPREITQPDPHGEDFLPQLYAAMLEAFFAEINSFISSIGSLLNLNNLLGDLSSLGGLVEATEGSKALPAAIVDISRFASSIRGPQI
ncbi:MAG: hypothetical protein JXQ73_07655 [Phycisphaerae bacterium]|nr:hypothetical protein [Phycisphaerae bacterium]